MLPDPPATPPATLPGTLPAISAENLVKQFRGGGEAINAVDQLSFRVERGEVYGLLGPNGAGKTTTLRLILGLLAPDEGRAMVDGWNATESPAEVKSRIGFVSASAGLYPWHTVRETLLYFGDLYGLDDAEAEANLDRLADVLDLRPLLDRRGVALSTGQKQRVALARGLIHDPPVMMLDEPTRGLDVALSQVIFEYVEHLRARNKAVLVCTHRLDQAQRICDRFGLLHQGRLVHEGDLPTLQQQTGHEMLVDMFLQILKAVPAGAGVS